MRSSIPSLPWHGTSSMPLHAALSLTSSGPSDRVGLVSSSAKVGYYLSGDVHQYARARRRFPPACNGDTNASTDTDVVDLQYKRPDKKHCVCLIALTEMTGTLLLYTSATPCIRG